MTNKDRAEHRNVTSLKPGERIEDQVYRIASKELRTTSNGSLYVHAVLADATGQILGRMWNASQEIYDSIPEGGFLLFRGRVESYKGKPQFIIDGLRAVDEGTFDASDFLPATKADVAALWNELKDILRAIQHRDLRNLVARFINDEDFARQFQRAPAAMALHQAWLGGLLEHTVNLLRLARAICPLYPQVSQDLVLAGVFLHDAGKTRELAYTTNFEYTNEGQLIGHITQTVLWIQQTVSAMEAESGQPFPPDVLMLLQHIILAHHGKYEFGSPRLPATPEAMLIHYLDNLDAKLNMMFEAIESDPDAASDWTSYIRAIETKVFKPDVMGTRPAP
ncbi:MAG: HD domain-containing protein [Phycisphaerae bacterium]|jgi:3'-5' exoribonuclease